MKRRIFLILSVAMIVTGLSFFSGSLGFPNFLKTDFYRQEEKNVQAAAKNKKEAEHQVLVCFEKKSVQRNKGISAEKKRLAEVRKRSYVSDDFGAVMSSVKKASEIAATVSSQKDILSKESENDYVIEDSISFDNYIISLVSSKTENTETMIKKLEKNKDIKYVTPNYVVHADSADFSLNDPYIEYSYPLADGTAKNEKTGKNISTYGSVCKDELKDSSMHVTDVWQAYQNRPLDEEEIVVAILDTGIDYYHEELLGHLWENPDNIGLVGKYGYDFIENDADPMDDNGHGTHCAGIIAAQADNEQGISGVLGKYADDKVKLMALKVFDEKGAESTEFAVLGAFRYILTAVENGVNVRVANNSWGADGNGLCGALFDEILSELGKKGVLMFFAAGNSGADLDQIDASPASSTLDHIVCVGSINEQGDKAFYSNYGKSQVDFFAPGSNVLSSVSYENYLPVIYTKEQIEKTTKTYGVFDGNSITPVTAGAEVSSFGAPVVFDQDGKEITEGVKISVSEERYKNTKTKKSLKVEFSEVEAGDTYYIYFPYQTETKADGKNVYVAGSVGIPYNLEQTHQAYFGIADMLRYEDGTVRRPLIYAQSYSALAADHNLCDFSSNETFSYTEAKAAASHGIAVMYKSEKTAPAVLYIDGLAVSKAGADTASFGKYAFYSGTSMACPNAAGAAALLLAGSPELQKEKTAEGTLKLKNLLLSSVKRSGKVKGLCTTNGVLNLSKVISENLEPVISSATVDTKRDTVTLSGINFGGEKGELLAVHAIDGRELLTSPEEVLSWGEKDIVLKDMVQSDNSYKFRGNYITFTIKTKSGKESSNTFYISDGIKNFQKISKSLISDKEEIEYAGLVSDGSDVYGITNVGSIYSINAKTGERIPFISIKSALNQLLTKKYSNLGIDQYELNNSFFISVLGNPVCMNGVIYEWLSIRASDRKFYLGLKLDVESLKPAWKIISVEINPKKNSYKKIPKVFMFDSPAVSEYKGKIYAVGGYSKGAESIGSFLVYVFDPETEEWKFTGESLPGSAFGLHLEESHGMLYAFLGSSAYKLSADIQQPDRRIFCYDGNSWKTLDEKIPFFLKTYLDSNSMIFSNAATAVTGEGILITGTSTDGYGDTFLLDTRKKEKISFYPLNLSFYGGLSTGEKKLSAETTIWKNGKEKDAIVVLSDDIEDSAAAYSLYIAELEGTDSAYYSIDFKTKGNGKGKVYGLKRVKKYGDYKESFTVVPNKNSVITSVVADKKVLKAVSGNKYEFCPEKDTEVVVTFSTKAKEQNEAVKEESKAELKVKKKTLKRGSTYQIKVQNKNGQSVLFSISKSAKKSGISVTSKGKVTVKKNAKAGTYHIEVLVKENSKYKEKKLRFTVIVKKK